MPIEDRKITFFARELYQALYAHNKRSERDKLPVGEITDVRFIGKDEDMIEVTFVHKAEEQTNKMEFSRTFTAAALIMYCRGAGIPVPRASRKSLEIEDNQVVLRSIL